MAITSGGAGEMNGEGTFSSTSQRAQNGERPWEKTATQDGIQSDDPRRDGFDRFQIGSFS
jgi:hypothetical protein